MKAATRSDVESGRLVVRRHRRLKARGATGAPWNRRLTCQLDTWLENRDRQNVLDAPLYHINIVVVNNEGWLNLVGMVESL